MKTQLMLLAIGLIFVCLCALGLLGTAALPDATPTPLPNVTRIIVDGRECVIVVIVVIAENTFGYGCKDE